MTLDTAALPADGAELIEASLDAVAASGIDIVPEFFVRFFATRPEQRDNFQRPVASQGKMVREMLDFLTAQSSDEGWMAQSFESCIDRHHSYADIDPADFAKSLALLVETMAAAAGPRWKPEFTRAWSAKVEILSAINTKSEIGPIGSMIGHQGCQITHGIGLQSLSTGGQSLDLCNEIPRSCWQLTPAPQMHRTQQQPVYGPRASCKVI